MRKRNKTFLALLIISFCGTRLFAEEKYNLSRFVDETGDFLQAPLKWQTSDYLKLGAVAAATVLVMPADGPIRDDMLKDRSFNNNFVIVGGRVWGEWYSAPILAGAFALHGWTKNCDSSARIGFELIQAAVYSAAITELLKMGFGRARPYMNEGATDYKPFNRDPDYNSFPSGHVTNAFAISTVLAKNVDSDVLKGLIYVPAVCTAVSRAYEDQHWASDCVLGAAIGYFCGVWVVDHHGQKKSPVKISSIYPPTVSIEF